MSQESLFGAEPEYDLIVIDAPWDTDAGGGGRGAQEHYSLSRRDSILRTVVDARLPDGTRAWNPAAAAHLRCWATSLSLLDAVWLVQALGFHVASHDVWVKAGEWRASDAVYEAASACLAELMAVTPADHSSYEALVRAVQFAEVVASECLTGGAPGLGQYRRSAHELLLLGTRGPFARGPGATTTSSIVGGRPLPVPRDARGRKIHSRKPPEAYDHIEATSPYRRRIEFFARSRREGWTSWGDQVDLFEEDRHGPE